MIQVTFNFATTAAAAAMFTKLNGLELAAMSASVGPEEKQAVLVSNDKAETVKQLAAPGKPSAAKTAASPRTAAADPSPTAPSDAAPAQSTEATKPDAAATYAAPPVVYADLQKAVLTLHKLDASAAVPIAKSLGADTFKLLPQDKWAEALRLVTEAIAARG